MLHHRPEHRQDEHAEGQKVREAESAGAEAGSRQRSRMPFRLCVLFEFIRALGSKPGEVLRGIHALFDP